MTTGGASTFTITIPRRRRSAGAAALPRQVEEPSAAHGSDASPSSNLVGPAPSPASRNKEPMLAVEEEEERRRLLKGKMLAAVDERPPRASAGAGGPNKLMGDAIRCHVVAGNNNACSNNNNNNNNNKKRKDHRGSRSRPFWFGTGPDGQSTSSAGSETPVSLATLHVATPRLRATLRDLGATDPTRVYGKMMSCSDRMMQQCRLLMSCKSWRADADGPFPLDALLTGREKEAARGAGLEVLALDRAGEVYDGMKCKYLHSNKGYRVIGQWGDFLKGTGLVAKGSGGGGGARANDVMIDLWLFRCPGGRLGIVFLHYRKGDAAHADAAFEEEMGKPPRKIRRRGGAATEDDDVVVMEDDGYDGVREEEAAGDAHGEAAPPLASSPGTIAATTVEEEETGSEEQAAVTLAPDHADDANDDEEEPGARGKATSPSYADDGAAKAAEGGSAPSSWEADARGKALDVLLSSCKQDVLQAAETLMEMSRGVW